ncbi:MAG TPA: ribonuclease H [Acidimicrobiales bacterium]|nr:ribonuclease H [Acidimicrobiales bacterium]
MTAVYTDGACSGNPGPGGWAWAIEDGPYASGYDERTTNQRMEVTAAFEAVRANDGPLEVVSDSTYVVNCFRDSWWVGWRKRGWRNTQRQPVANRDLWEPFVELVLERGDVTFRWVKGHAGDPMNDLVDRLAVQAVTDGTGRRGTGRPDDLGAADAPPKQAAGGATGGPALPDGYRVVITGLRPPGLGGYDPNLTWESVRSSLAEALAYLATEHDDLLVVTGMGLGTEQLGAEAAIDAGVPFVAVPAHRGFDEVWPARSRERYRSLVDQAIAEVVFDDRVPTSKQQAGAMASRRDAWLARNAAEAIVVHDGEDEHVERRLAALTVQLGDDNVLQLRP